MDIIPGISFRLLINMEVRPAAHPLVLKISSFPYVKLFCNRFKLDAT